MHRTWRLNERHYGALTGRTKVEVRAEVGDERFDTWRRSFATAPPPIDPAAGREFSADPRCAALPPGTVPATESLADVLARLLPYWVEVLATDVRAGRTPLVVAHGNSLRALVTRLDGLSAEQVGELDVPTGIPLCCTFDAGLRPVGGRGRYLDPDTAACAAAARVAEEGR